MLRILFLSTSRMRRRDIYRRIYLHVKRYLLTYLNLFSLFIRLFIPTVILHRHPLVCDSLAQQKTSACWLQSSVSSTAMTSRSGSSTSGPLGSLQPDRAPPWLWVDEPCSVNATQWNPLKGHPWIKDTHINDDILDKWTRLSLNRNTNSTEGSVRI